MKEEGNVCSHISPFLSKLRYVAALTSAVLLATDYYRNPFIFTSFSIWILILHFIYFQLPLKSKAMAYFHGVSFIASIVTPCMYVYLLYFHSSIEQEHMEEWNLPPTTIYLRTAAIYVAPIVYHTIEISTCSPIIVASYRNKNLSLVALWTFAFLATLSVVYEFTFPESDDTDSLHLVEKDYYFRFQKVIFFGILLFSFAIYCKFVLQKALNFQTLMRGRKSSGNLHEKTQ